MSTLTGVNVVIECLENHPTCPHGPTILFQRSKYNFFACSACRNRKDCPFFMLQDDWLKRKKEKSVSISPIILNKKMYSKKNITLVKLATKDDRAYCHTCSELFLLSKDKEDHSSHDFQSNLDDNLLTKPSKLFKPLGNDKKEAQYFFSNESINLIMGTLQKNKLRNILCLGTPRVHEYIQNNARESMVSILLDIDNRHQIFYPPVNFCHYNMFNNHFFNGIEEIDVLKNFVLQDSGQKTCIIMDPPFGGRLELLGQTLRTISKLSNSHSDDNEENEKLLPTMLILPYFMEPQVNNHISDLIMCDYQVIYENHSKFQTQNMTKKGSGIRIFTNIPLHKFPLPTEGGYKYCKPCNRWVGEWNKHCSICESCTSKNGSTYIHCDICKRCVKTSWAHCTQCKRCCLKHHTCGVILKNQVCFNCQEIGHKKSECPVLKNGKRKIQEDQVYNGKKSYMSKIDNNDISDLSKVNLIHSKAKKLKQKRNKKKERQTRIKKIRNR